MSRRIVFAALIVAAAAALAPVAFGATPKPSLAAYQACLKTHGVTFGGTGKTVSAAKMQAAFKACATLAPAGVRAGGTPGQRPHLTAAQRAAFKKYQTCMTKHGVTFKRGTRPNVASAKYKAASKACASLRPKLPGRPQPTS